MTRGSGDPRPWELDAFQGFVQPQGQPVVVLHVTLGFGEAVVQWCSLFTAFQGVDQTLQLVLCEGQGGGGVVHGCRCEVGRSRNRFPDFVALNIPTRPEPAQGKVTELHINCTDQFPNKSLCKKWAIAS